MYDNGSSPATSGDDTSFGTWFRALLQDRSTTMTAIARLAGVSIATCSRWGSNMATPDVDACQVIASVLDVPVNLVLTRAGHAVVQDVTEQHLLDTIRQLEGDQQQKTADLERLRRELERYYAELAQLYHDREKRERIVQIQTWSAAIAQELLSRPTKSLDVAIDRIQRKLLDAEASGELTWRPVPRQWESIGSA